MVTVFSVFGIRQDTPSHSDTFSIVADNLATTASASLPCVKMTYDIMTAYIKVSTPSQIERRTLKYMLKSSGPRIDPCGAPKGQALRGDVLSFILTH